MDEAVYSVIKQQVDNHLNSLSDIEKNKLAKEMDKTNTEIFEDEYVERAFQENSKVIAKIQLESDSRIWIVASGIMIKKEEKTNLIMLPVYFDKQDNNRMDVIKFSQLDSHVVHEVIQKHWLLEFVAKDLLAA